MNLTPTEQKMVARLRHEQRIWRRKKWWCLIGGLVVVAMNSWGLMYIIEIKSDDVLWEFLFLFSYPTILVGALVGSIMIGIALRDWHGNTTDTLLLKLLDERAEPK